MEVGDHWKSTRALATEVLTLDELQELDEAVGSLQREFYTTQKISPLLYNLLEHARGQQRQAITDLLACYNEFQQNGVVLLRILTQMVTNPNTPENRSFLQGLKDAQRDFEDRE